MPFIWLDVKNFDILTADITSGNDKFLSFLRVTNVDGEKTSPGFLDQKIGTDSAKGKFQMTAHCISPQSTKRGPYGKNRLLVKKGLAKCFQCKKVKPYIREHWDIPLKSTRWAGFTCKDCHSKRRKKVSSSLKGRIQKLLHDARIRAKKKNLSIDINQEFLQELLDLQCGKCFYTKQEMTPESNNWNTMSIDRKDPSAGYTKDNVAICCDIVNRMKSYLNIQDFVTIAKLVATEGAATVPALNIKRLV